MRIAFVSPPDHDALPRLAVDLGDHRLVDVPQAAALARINQDESGRVPTATTVKELFEGGEGELSALRQLIDWVRQLAPDDATYSSAFLDERAVRFHPPVPDADKFLCVGKNYRAHLEELVRADLIREIPEEPTAFVQLNSAMAGHDENVVRPADITQMDYEPELAFVIGRHAHGVKREEAMDYVAGITLLNDLTARELQKREVRAGTRFWTGKNIPGFGPVGPYIVTLDEAGDVSDLEIACFVNGEERSRFNTSDQIFTIPDIIEHFSRYVPLQPGDLFATGSASGVAVGQEDPESLYLKPGDVVEVHLGTTMVLRNMIVAPEHGR